MSQPKTNDKLTVPESLLQLSRERVSDEEIWTWARQMVEHGGEKAIDEMLVLTIERMRNNQPLLGLVWARIFCAAEQIFDAQPHQSERLH